MSLGWFDPELHPEELTLIRVSSGRPGPNGRAPTTTTRVPLVGYSVQPAGSSESDGDEACTLSKLRVSGPATSEVHDKDLVSWRGVDYQVDGEPQTFGTVLPHTELTLRKVKG